MSGRPVTVVGVVVVALLVLAYLFWSADKPPARPGSLRQLTEQNTPESSPAPVTPTSSADGTPLHVTRPNGRPLSMTYLGDQMTIDPFTSRRADGFAARVTDSMRKGGPVQPSMSGLFDLTARQALVAKIPANQDLVIVAVGTYDYALASHQEFDSAYPRLIDRIRRLSPRSKIVCVTPWLPPGRGFDFLVTVRHACSVKASEVVVDLTNLLDYAQLRAEKGGRYWDGVIPYSGLPNDRGNQAIATAIEGQLTFRQ